jgi:hypothetical protein
MSSDTDEFVPVPKPSGLGKTQQWIADKLVPRPGVWRRYPYPIENAAACVYAYPRKHEGTEWAVDADGNLGARWVGIEEDDD